MKKFPVTCISFKPKEINCLSLKFNEWVIEVIFVSILILFWFFLSLNMVEQKNRTKIIITKSLTQLLFRSLWINSFIICGKQVHWTACFNLFTLHYINLTKIIINVMVYGFFWIEWIISGFLLTVRKIGVNEQSDRNNQFID